MNTINPVRSYMNLRNNQQTPNTQPQAPAFKGDIGKRVVEEIAYKKTLTIASILAMLGGVIGLSKDKVSDVLESLIDRIKTLQTDNASLVNEKANLEKQNTIAQNEIKKVRQESVTLSNRTSSIIEAKDVEISAQKARIKELEKYAAMAKVKSVDELDIISPEQFLELLKEAKEAQPKAEQSLLNYLFNGNGQEEFLAQMERSNKILKARSSGIAEIPEMKEAFEGLKMTIGFDPAYVAQQMMEKALKHNEKGAQVNYAPIRKQLQENADAIINPMMNKNYYYKSSNETILKEVADFYKELAYQKEVIMKERNLKFEQRNINSKNRPYYSFVNNQNEKFDIYLEDLARGNLGYGRWTYADGSVDSWTKNGYWE